MKKQMLLLVVSILLLIGGCNYQTKQQSDQLNQIDNSISTNQQIQNSQNDNSDSSSSKEDNNTQSVDVPEKQVWLNYFSISSPEDDGLINITNFPNEDYFAITFQDFIKKIISDKTLLEEVSKEGYDVKLTPSSEYLILEFPQEYTKYVKYDIIHSAKNKFPNIENYLYKHWGPTGPVYSVIYSIKQKRMIDLNDVKNDSDKESIYDWILDRNSFYVNSLDTIKQVNFEGYSNYQMHKYRDFKEDTIVLQTNNNKTYKLVFYNLINGKVEDYIEIPNYETYGGLYISQWNEDGTILFTINNFSYEYNFHTQKLTTLGENMFFPVKSLDGKFLIYSADLMPIATSPDAYLRSNEGEYPGIYSKNLVTGEINLIKQFETPYYDGLKIITINNY